MIEALVIREEPTDESSLLMKRVMGGRGQLLRLSSKALLGTCTPYASTNASIAYGSSVPHCST